MKQFIINNGFYIQGSFSEVLMQLKVLAEKYATVRELLEETAEIMAKE